MRGAVELVGARLVVAVLARLVLQVEVEVAVVVAGLLVIDGRIDDAELLAYRGHEVGGAVDDGVLFERLLQADQR